jgi:hypothetical protein
MLLSGRLMKAEMRFLRKRNASLNAVSFSTSDLEMKGEGVGRQTGAAATCLTGIPRPRLDEQAANVETVVLGEGSYSV